ncbi:S4 domain-containing protein YaaA [Indiicoccus explosivorum]|uniref:S4 domain-containing protein YaaA n=1 Tax=Indiicoccus explosivorum TaxID=1917864 RepID=UPI003B97FBDB
MTIESEFVTLGQFLKMINAIQSGGMAKWFLSEYTVFVNGEAEDRRGRKLYPGDVITVPGAGRFRLAADESVGPYAD